MTTHFFGEPWGNENKRAAICEDDQYRIPVPVGTKCLLCTGRIEEHHRGVVTACSPNVFGRWVMDDKGVQIMSGRGRSVCSYHMLCFIKSTIGSDGLSQEIIAKMNYQVVGDDTMALAEEPAPAEINVVPGRGWRKRSEEEE